MIHISKRVLLVLFVATLFWAGTPLAFSQPLPDLTVTRIEVEPSVPKPRELALVKATVENVGEGPAGFFRVGLRVDGRFASNQRVQALEPGATTVVTFQWFGLEGSRVLRVEANLYNDVEESDQDNNILEANVDVLPDPLPDLLIESVRFEPEFPQPGETATLVVQVRNGGRIAPSSRAILVAKDGRRTLRTLFLDPLEAGQSVTLEIPWRPREGEGLLSFEIDAQERIEEVSELNNLVTQIYNVSSRPSTGADLTITGLETVPESPVPGQMASVTVTVLNTGQGVASDFAVRLEVDGQAVQTVAVEHLDPGAHTTVSFFWQAESAGEHLLRAKADEAGLVVEPNEADNVFSTFVQAGEPMNVCGQAVYLRIDEAGVQFLSGTLSLTPEQVKHVFLPKVKQAMEEDFAGVNIRFFLEEPALTHSTLRLIGDSRRDRLGEAPVDVGNFIKNDQGTVFLGSFETLLAGGRTLDAFATLVANTASHETGHFLGLPHDDVETTRRFAGQNMMADGSEAPGSSVFLDAFFTEENKAYFEQILPLQCAR